MRLLVTGAGGQLGGDLVPIATRAGHQVTAADSAACDITDEASIANALDEARPDALVNCAAWSRVDAAEREVDAAYLVNAIGPRLLADACERRNILLTHLSTDYVFDGTAREPVEEWHATGPRSVYGASKLAGELELRHGAPRHQLVRTSWLYGRGGPNFVLTMLRLAGEGNPLRVVDDQTGAPTWTVHLAAALVRLVERGTPGTYHLTNAGATTWHGFAKAIMTAAGHTVPVIPIRTEDYPVPAPRPAYSVLDNRAWRLLGEAQLPSWQDGLRGYVEELRGTGRLTEPSR